MESDRPHRTTSATTSTTTTTSTSELFICFAASRLSSSMKLTSKSLLSPARSRDPTSSSQISLSTSLSRRLKSSGSIKGGASPMFPSTTGGATTKKRGCAFENPEPSSPKVTCIGQVRVKTKKQGKKMRIITRSKRNRASSSTSGGSDGAASFRKVGDQSSSVNASCTIQSQELLHFPNHHHHLHQQQQRNSNQRWVHLPLAICEALRAFGSEFNCLVPNRSSCLASEDSNGSKEEKRRLENGAPGSGSDSDSSSSSCGAVFARWFVAMQDGEGGKGREIELVVGDEENERNERTSGGGSSSGSSSSRGRRRQQVFEGIEGLMEEEEKQGGGRVSVCVPPKNALLLMRCRSDPVKMAALANKFWEMPAVTAEEEEEEEEDEGIKVNTQGGVQVVEEAGAVTSNDEEEVEKLQTLLEAEVKNLVLEEVGKNPVKIQQLFYGDEVNEVKSECQVTQEELLLEEEEICLLDEEDIVGDPERLKLEENYHEVTEAVKGDEEEEDEKLPEASIELPEASMECEQLEEREEVEVAVAEELKEEETEAVNLERSELEPETDNPNTRLDSGSKRAAVLPDCLLLMMCEPKLSMEVSKETWVCTTDFIRCLPERHVKKIDGPDGEAKKRVSIDKKPPMVPAAPVQKQQMVVVQPPRSSCSFPIQGGPVSMATMIGQKLVGSNGYEPFVLTRCKSEPMRTAGKLAAAAPEMCFWKNRKMEPHRRVGVGAAGVGF